MSELPTVAVELARELLAAIADQGGYCPLCGAGSPPCKHKVAALLILAYAGGERG